MAQSLPSIAPAMDGTGTQVVPKMLPDGSKEQLDIQGGVQVNQNLFHSFERFNLNPNQIANFISNPTIQNILGRVVGSDASVIQGLIQVTGGNSNLYLINPSGVLFGATAQLNVPASFYGSTASAIGFGSDRQFRSTGANDYAALVGPPDRFAFLAQHPGLMFNAGNLQVGTGHHLSLTGGTVINTGTLSAPGGTVTIAAIPNQNIVRIHPAGSILSLDVPATSTHLKPLPELLTGGTLSQATGVTIENGVVKLTRSNAEIANRPGTAIASGHINASTVAIGGNHVTVLNPTIAATTVETSGKTSLNVVGGTVKAQHWSIDPIDLRIAKPTPTATGSTIDPIAIAAALDAGTNVAITTEGAEKTGGDMTLADSIDQTRGGAASLTLTGRRFTRSDNAQINLTSSGGLTFNLNQVNPEPNPPSGSIQAAIEAIGSVKGDRTINLGAGVYSGAPLTIDRSLTLRGASRDTTILSGSNVHQVLQIAGATVPATVTLNHLTIANGKTPGDGGGVFVTGKNMTVNVFNSTVTQNRASHGGGIFNAMGSTVNITNSQLSNNAATEGGGGVESVFGSNLTIANSTIVNNTAKHGGGVAIYKNNTGVIQNSNISGNRAENVGGGIINTQTNMAIENTTIRNNNAGSEGGGIYNLGVSDVRNSTIENNTAHHNGGGIKNESVLRINGSTVANNNATQNGGGIDNRSILVMQGGKIQNNSAAQGGGIANYNNTSELTLLKTEVLNNRASRGGGLFNVGDRFVAIHDSLIAGNVAIAEPGGGIFSVGNDVSIVNSTVSNNEAATTGGGVAAFGRTAIDRSTLSHNQAGTEGGGLFVNHEVTLTNSNVVGNHAQLQGGGIRNLGTLTIAGSTVNDNRTNRNGGAIDNTGQLSILNSTIAHNSATQNGGAVNSSGFVYIERSRLAKNMANQGGGISIESGNATIDRTTIADNIAIQNGGGVHSNDTTTIVNSTVSGNAANQGGGIANSAILNATGVTISGNTANTGAGIFNDAGINTSTIRSNTITNNHANTAGGGIFNASGNISIANTIVARNWNGDAPDISGVFIDNGNNLIGVRDGSRGFTISTLVGTLQNPIDPQLEPLANNGGETQTHALRPNSPAVNAGNNQLAPQFDQRGNLRILRGTIDIGAIESDWTTLPPVINPPTGNPTTPPTNPIAPIINLDQSLSNDYEQYYNLDPKKKLRVTDIESTLDQMTKQKNIRSVVIYAVFTPQTIAPASGNGDRYHESAEPVTPFLRAKIKRPDDRLDLVLVTPTGHSMRFSTSATRSQVVQQAKLFRLAVSDLDDDAYGALSRQLYGWLVQPLEAELMRHQVNSLIFCLDEGLRTTPVAAMSDSRGFAIDRYTISIIPSMSLVNRDVIELRDRGLLAMGADRFQSLEPLPAVPTELDLVSRQFWNGHQVLNQNFTLEELMRRKQLENPGILHLATHAQFNPGSPDQSYIQLWDQQIKLSQMKSLGWANPPLELLVLSACETAIGSSEAELGFAGLATASGVRSVLGSLWDVSDLGTLALMSEFYIQLKQAPTRSEALRRAQVALRNGTVRIENGTLITSQKSVVLPPNIVIQHGTISFTHPFYWSAFTLVGNPW